MSDWSMACHDCGRVFVFSEPEQVFFESKGLAPPKRCRACRAARRVTGRRAAAPSAELRSAPSLRSAIVSAPSQRSEGRTWEACCSGCGGRAVVPFEPQPRRDVFCALCWRQRRDAPIARDDSGIIE